MTQRWDDACDVLVAGSGGGALAGALLAASRGLRTVVVEKDVLLGGTTSYSGGGLWIPLCAPNERAGVEDSRSAVDTYLDATVGPERRWLRDAYVDAGPGVIDELEKNPWLEFEWRPFPDYFCEKPGAQTAGRSIYALNFDVTGHEHAVEHLGGPLPAQQGGWREPYPSLYGGRALLGRLLVALGETDTTIRRQCALESLVVEDGRVVGAIMSTPDGLWSVKAERGVLLAAGGFERDASMRDRFGVPGDSAWSLGAPGNTGAALRAAIEAGASVELVDEGWWAPGLALPDGSVSFRLFERGKPGGLMVNAAGKRFADETWPYDRLGRAIVEGHRGGVPHIPCWFVVDQHYVDRYGFATGKPGVEIGEAWLSSGAVVSAPTLSELASRIGVDGPALESTVEEFNRYASAGRDEDFGRGELAYDRFFGDASHQPNPNLGPLVSGPFHAWKILPADLGTKGGVRCDAGARALRVDDSVIPGLYAAGNTMASWTNHCYPGPGSPIGSSVVFSALAVKDMAGG